MSQKIRSLLIKESLVEKATKLLQENNITVYDEETIEKLLNKLMPAAPKRIRAQLTRELTQKKVYTLPDHIKNDVNRKLKELPYYIDLIDEMTDIGFLPVGFNLVPARSNEISNPTEAEAIKRITKKEDAVAEVEKAIRALLHIPEKFRQGVWEHVLYRLPYSHPEYYKKGERTWQRYVAQFKYFYAMEIGYKDILEVI